MKDYSQLRSKRSINNRLYKEITPYFNGYFDCTDWSCVFNGVEKIEHIFNTKVQYGRIEYETIKSKVYNGTFNVNGFDFIFTVTCCAAGTVEDVWKNLIWL